MKLFKRPSKMERELAAHDRSEAAVTSVRAAGDGTPCIDQYDEVTTPNGRTAHLRHRVRGVIMCGWPAGSWQPAKPGMQRCRLCVIAALAADEGQPQPGAESGAA